MANQQRRSKQLSETELLIRGANMAASGIQEGYTPEQTLDMLRTYFQKQGTPDVQGYAQQSLESALEFAPETTEITNQRRIEAEKALREQSQGIRHRGTMVDPDSWDQKIKIADIEGRDQSDFQQFGGFDSVRGRTRDYGADRAGRIEAGLIPRPEMSRSEKLIRDEAVGRATSGTGGVRDALNTLQAKIAEVGYDALPPETREVERRLVDSLEYGSVQRGAERSLVRDLVREDSNRFSTAIAQENYLRAAEEASRYGQDFVLGGQGVVADQALANIGQITNLGQVKAKEPFSIVPNSEVSSFGNAEWQGIPGGNENTGYYLDPRTGQPILVNEAPSTAISGVNTPTSSQALNAPIGPSRYHVSQTSMDWITQNRPGETRDFGGGLNFGNYPQVDIGGTTADFSSRLQQLGNKNRNLYPGLVGVSPNVRNIGEFDKAVNYIINQKLSSGGAFFSKDPLTGQQTAVAAPGPSDVLRELGMSSTEEEALKNALLQLTLAEESTRKGEYVGRREAPPQFRRDDPNSAIIFNAPEAVDRSRGTAEVALIGKDTKLKHSNKTVRGLLNTIKNDPEVSAPFMGATADEGEAPIRRQRAGGMDPVDVRVQQETWARKNRKLPSNARVGFGVLGPDEYQKIRDYQVNNALLTEDVKRELRGRGESTAFLAKGPVSRPLPTMIPTSPAMGFTPDMTEGFDYGAWQRRQPPVQQVPSEAPAAFRARGPRSYGTIIPQAQDVTHAVMRQRPSVKAAELDAVTGELMSRMNKRMEANRPVEAATSPPPDKAPPTPVVATAAPQPWHQGRKRYIAGATAGLGSIGLIANELLRRKQEEEQQGVLR